MVHLIDAECPEQCLSLTARRFLARKEISELLRHRPGRGLVFDAALIQLSVVLLRSLRGNHSARAAAAYDVRASQSQIARAVDLIHGCFRDDLSLDDLAGAAAMSRYHFLRCFKAQVGTTPYAYLLQVRLRRAAAMLRSPDWQTPRISMQNHWLLLEYQLLG